MSRCGYPRGSSELGRGLAGRDALTTTVDRRVWLVLSALLLWGILT